MSKVGENMIQGAIEALEFAKGKDNESIMHVPQFTKKSGTSRADSKTIEGGSHERP